MKVNTSKQSVYGPSLEAFCAWTSQQGTVRQRFPLCRFSPSACCSWLQHMVEYEDIFWGPLPQSLFND